MGANPTSRSSNQHHRARLVRLDMNRSRKLVQLERERLVGVGRKGLVDEHILVPGPRGLDDVYTRVDDDFELRTGWRLPLPCWRNPCNQNPLLSLEGNERSTINWQCARLPASNVIFTRARICVSICSSNVRASSSCASGIPVGAASTLRNERRAWT